MDFEDRFGQVLRIFPKELRKEALKRLREFKSIAELTEWVRVHTEAERDCEQADRAVRPRGAAAELLEPEENDTGANAVSLEDMEALMSLGADASPEELLAIQRRFQKAGARPPSRSQPTDRRRVQCTNCGRMGHTAVECRSQGPPANRQQR